MYLKPQVVSNKHFQGSLKKEKKNTMSRLLSIIELVFTPRHMVAAYASV